MNSASYEATKPEQSLFQRISWKSFQAIGEAVSKGDAKAKLSPQTLRQRGAAVTAALMILPAAIGGYEIGTSDTARAIFSGGGEAYSPAELAAMPQKTETIPAGGGADDAIIESGQSGLLDGSDPNARVSVENYIKAQAPDGEHLQPGSVRVPVVPEGKQ